MYRVVLESEGKTHVVYKRYSQFTEFDNTIKSLFPRIDLPSLPSKFSILNKVEKRREAFNKYLEGILQMSIKFPPLPKDTLMKGLGEFLDIYVNDRKSEEPKAPITKRESLVEENQIDPSSGHIKGYM